MDTEEKIEEIRRKIKAIDWDRASGHFNKKKIRYYKSLLKEYDSLNNKHEAS